VDRIASFDAFRFIDMISPRPLLMIVGAKAITSWMAKDAYANAKEPKVLFWVDGTSHVDLYDKDKYVTPVALKLGDFFRTKLTA
jgi:fermentation-respiration switch protein FrsA (DUF1100 family)